MRPCLIGLLAVLLSWCETQVMSQTNPARSKGDPVTRIKTEITFELITGSTAGVIEAQRWGELLSRLGVSVQSRPNRDGKPDIKETKQGSVRRVQVTATIDGAVLVVPGRKFSLDREQTLRDWLRDIETYGAQGRPDGQPGFGLSSEQFNRLFTELEIPVGESTEGRDFDAAIAAVGLPHSLRPRLLAEAIERRQSLPRTWRMSGELKGLSRGTGLAILLANAGLAFRPGRTPAGELELIGVRLEDAGVWPIGWPLEKPPLQAMPAMVEVVPLEFDEVPLATVLELCAEQTETRILVDRYRAEAKGRDLRKLTVSQLPTRTMWSLFLQRATGPHQMMRELLVDEAGTPFVWITTVDPKRLNDRERQRDALLEKKDRTKGK